MKHFLKENPTETILYSMVFGRENKIKNLDRTSQIFGKIVGEITINIT